RSRAPRWCAWPCGARRGTPWSPSARPSWRASPPRWGPSWSPSSPAWSSAPPSAGRCCEDVAVTAPKSAAGAMEAWMGYLANERRSSPRTLEAYRRCVEAYLAFLEQHRGGPQTTADLGEVSAGDLRAYLAQRRRPGDANPHGPLSARSLGQALAA